LHTIPVSITFTPAYNRTRNYFVTFRSKKRLQMGYKRKKRLQSKSYII